MSLLRYRPVQRALIAGFNGVYDTGPFLKWTEWMEGRGSWRDIRRYEQPYLQRYYLSKFGHEAYFLHCFAESDLDGLHDHPWPWERLILRGSYYEEHHDGTRTLCGPGDFAAKSARELHRVQLIDAPVWTLFYHGKRERDWGFQHLTRGPVPDTGTTWTHFWEKVENDRQPSSRTVGWLFPRIQE